MRGAVALELLALALVGLLGVAGLLIGRSPAARQAVLERAFAVVESRYGVALAARDVVWDPVENRLALAGLEFGARGSRPWLRAEAVLIEVRLAALLGANRRIDSIELLAPTVDLGAPFPDLGGGDSGQGQGGVEVGRLLVRRGAVEGVPVPAAADPWLRRAAAAGIEIRGALRQGQIDLFVPRSALELEGERLGRVDTRLSGRFHGPLAGPWRLENVRLAGPGLEARADAAFGVASGSPAEGSFQVSVAPAQAFPGRGLGGTLTAEGRLDLRRQQGSVLARVEDLPGETVEGLLPASEEASGTPLAGTRSRLEADLSLGPDSLQAISGRIALEVRRGDRLLLIAQALPGADPQGGLQVPLRLDLLPEAAGRRRLEATLAAENLAALGAGRWRQGRVDLQAPTAASLAEGLESLWPGLLADGLPGGEAARRSLGGALRVEGSFEGELLNPSVVLEGGLQTPGGRLSLEGSGRPVAGEGQVSVAARELDLGALAWGELDGIVTGRAAARRTAGAPPAAEWELSASELALPGDRRLDRLTLAGGLEASRLELRRLEADRGRLAVSGTGRATLADAGLPVVGASLDLAVRHPELGDTPAQVAARLERGSLRVELVSAGRGPAAEGPARAVLELPMGALGPSAAGWVAAPAGGALRAEWQLPQREWGPLLNALAPALAVERWQAGSAGRLVVDPASPAAAELEARLTGLAGRIAGVELRAAEGLDLRLAGGRFRLEPTALAVAEGQLAVEAEAEIDTRWTVGSPLVGGEDALLRRVDARARGRLPVALLPTAEDAAGDLEIDLAVAGTPDRPEIRLALDGPDVSWPLPVEAELRLTAPSLRAVLAGDRLTVDRAAVRLGEIPLELGGFAERGDQVLRLDLSRLALGDCAGRVRATLPAGLIPLPGAGAAGEGSGEVEADWQFAPCDWSPWIEQIAGADAPRLRTGLSGFARFDPSAPAAGQAELELAELEAVIGGRRLAPQGPVRWTLGDATLALEPSRWVADGKAFALQAEAELDPLWSLDRPVLEMVRRLRAEGDGTLVASLLDPVLAGGTASGNLDLSFELGGAPDRLSGRIGVSGREAAILYPSPYLTRLSDPDLELEFEGGAVTFGESRLRLNEGTVQIRGGLDTDGGVDLTAVFADVRYRLDYGLLATLGGFVNWRGRYDGDSVLSGRIRLASGTLTRPIELDRNLLSDLLVPVDLTATAGGPLERVALDLEISTREGVRVRNNLADLVVLWDPLRVTGTAELPLVEGRLEIQPGGVLYAPGQPLRLERGTITYSGQAGMAPEVDLSTTTTVDEEVFSRAALEDPLAPAEGEGSDPAGQLAAFSQGVALYYGEQIASRVGGALGGTEVSLRPVPVFGETDPAARLNLSRDVSPRVAVVASIDLRNAERQTYVLDLRDLPLLPGIQGQLFTLDDASEGATVQQSLLFGGGSDTSEAAVIRSVRFEGRPPGVSKRGLKRAVRLSKGDRLEAGDRFAAQVEVTEYLRGRGYAATEVAAEAAASPRRGGGVDLLIEIQAGPRAAFRFDGDLPPKRLRPSITSLYRADFWEEASIAEMRVQAERAFRSKGHLHPQVEIRVQPLEDGKFDRLVVVSSVAGPAITPAAPQFPDLPADEGEFVASRFWGPVQRTELAAALPEADRRVAQALDDLGYSDGRVVERQVSSDGRELVVRVQVGPRRRVAEIQIEGFNDPLLQPPLAVGDTARADRVAQSSIALERELEARGYSEARVRARLATSELDPLAVSVRFEIEPGIQYQFAEPGFEGLRATRERWARSIAGLPVGESFQEEKVQGARRDLYQTGLFAAVGSRVERSPDGDARVVFDLDERARYRFSYGLRWDSENGGSVVLDLVDSNFLGRGVELGLRTLYSQDDRSVRAAVDFPRAFGGRGRLQWFNLVRREVDDQPLGQLITDRLESTLQFGYPLGSRTRGRVYGSWLEQHVYEDNPFAFLPVDEQVQSPLLGVQLLYDSRGSSLLPERGLFASVDLSGSGEFLASDFRYLRSFGQLNYFRPAGRFGSMRLIWAQSLRLGAAEAFDQSLVRSNRFFAGGEYSVRGYPTESLGPEERLGGIVRPLGGEAVLVLNQELRVRIADWLTTLAFVDAGNVWRTVSEADTDLFKSAGIGFRALTPLGLLRVDAAYPLDRREGDPRYKIHFGFGTVF